MSHFISMMSTVLSTQVPLKVGDRFVVWILTVLSYALSGMEPEEMMGSVLITVGVLILSIGMALEFNAIRYMVILLGIAIVIFGAAAFQLLKLPLVPQDESTYGQLPIASNKDFPVCPLLQGPLVPDQDFFKDKYGRVVLLRGVNLGGDTKIPVIPDGASWRKQNFYQTKGLSFVGRPFPLEEADEHLGRLSAWGFTFLRFLITWEAIEHAGPGIYDQDYIEYVVQVIRKCREYGISVFVDPHQDVWSRWTGGDGAPAWTLEKVGFKLENLYQSGAAFSHQEHGIKIPQMIWPTNYNRLATATMFTLFFAGNTFAPKMMIDGEPAQDYLQSHYIKSVQQIANALKNEPNVLGYDTLNEPSTGYIGVSNLHQALFAAPLGWYMSGFQGMVLGAGRSVEIPLFEKPLVYSRTDTLNPSGTSAWQNDRFDVWRNEGVWKFDNRGVPVLLKPDHFAKHANGKPVRFMEDFMVPFFKKYEAAIHAVHPGVTIFAEPYIDPNSPKHATAPETLKGDLFAWAPHYYDALTLMLKKARPWVALDINLELPVLSVSAANGAIENNLHHVKAMGRTLGGVGKPVLIGEIGIQFDHDRDAHGMAAAYKNGDFSSQIIALDRSMRGLESNLLSYTVWCYAVSNNNRHGDNWNDEDLSLFSKDQQKAPPSANLHSGGRALMAAVRPYPMATAGIPVSVQFFPLSSRRTFRFTFTTSDTKNPVDPTQAPTLIFVPQYQYPAGITVTVSDGTFQFDAKNQFLTYVHDTKVDTHTITIIHGNEQRT